MVGIRTSIWIATITGKAGYEYHKTTTRQCRRDDHSREQHVRSEALDQALQQTDGGTAGARRRIGLIGFSGGAAIAALLAARRTDVAWLIDVHGRSSGG